MAHGSFLASVFLSVLVLASATIEDFSQETYPKIVLKVINLEQARDANNYSYPGITIPATKGFIELNCDAPFEGIQGALGFRLADTEKGVKWIMPNPKMITERRAYLSTTKANPSLASRLAITDFRPEDAGLYTCQIQFQDPEITQYKRSIYIPSLDGTPIMACQLECERNYDVNCQLMGEYSVSCRVFSNGDVDTECTFKECTSEEQCPLDIPTRIPQGVIPGFFCNEEAHIMEQRVFTGAKGLATASGRFTCRANTPTGSIGMTLHMPVSITQPRKGGPDINQGSFGPPPTFLSSIRPGFIKLGEEVELGCWTSKDIGRFQWSYKDIDGNVVDIDASYNRPGTSVRNDQLFGGTASRLHIESYNDEFGGTYTCKGFAQSENVLLGKEFKLPASKWAEDSDIGNRNTLTTSVGSTITINCHILSVRRPNSIIWSKKNSTRSEEEVIPESPRIQENQDKLTIQNVIQEDEGIYHCSMHRGFGFPKWEGEINLIVRDTPLDPYQKIQPLKDVVTSLKQAGHDICDVIRSFDPPN